MTTITTATTADARAAAEVYGGGTLDEAVYSWVIPDEHARRDHAAAQREHTTAWLTAAMTSGAVVIASSGDTVVGVSVWELMDGTAAQPDPADATAFIRDAYGEYAPRMMRVLEAVAARHPHDTPHWYLQQVVVDPEHRGGGVGGALIRAHLERVDADGLPAYLEASSPRNQRLYERLGFEPAGTPVTVAADGPRLQPMWRHRR